MKPEVLVVGAGVAGLSAAAFLAERRINTVVIENGLFPGGQTARLSCMAVESCAKCGACLLEESVAGLNGSSCSFICNTKIKSCVRTVDGFRVSCKQRPTYIDADKCVDCGKCFEICRSKSDAVYRSSFAWGVRYGIDPYECLFFPDSEKAQCMELCPVGAVDFSAQAVKIEFNVQAVVFAGGYTPFDPYLKPRFGYNRLANVVTSLELDEKLRLKGGLSREVDGVPPKSLAFIQCVGSRDKSIGRDYCSRVCCGYAMRLSALVRSQHPETSITIFYMDIQNAGRNFQTFYDTLKDQVEFIHGIPGELREGSGESVIVPYTNNRTGAIETREFDMVALSIGMGPPSVDSISIFNLKVGEDGFPVGDPEKRVFVAGSAAGPMGIAESRTAGRHAAAQAADCVVTS